MDNGITVNYQLLLIVHLLIGTTLITSYSLQTQLNRYTLPHLPHQYSTEMYLMFCNYSILYSAEHSRHKTLNSWLHLFISFMEKFFSYSVSNYLLHVWDHIWIINFFGTSNNFEKISYWNIQYFKKIFTQLDKGIVAMKFYAHSLFC